MRKEIEEKLAYFGLTKGPDGWFGKPNEALRVEFNEWMRGPEGNEYWAAELEAARPRKLGKAPGNSKASGPLTPTTWTTCFHEAAHAAVAWVLGYEIASVTTIPQDGLDGAVRYERAPSGDEAAMCFLAGPRGECSSDEAAGYPLHRAADARDKAGIESALHGGSLKLESFEYGRDFTALEKRVDDLLFRHWGRVAALARSLKAFRCLDGVAVHRILAGLDEAPTHEQAEYLDAVQA